MFGVARSEDYLEKIFQIPLWLRRMDANAARRMVQGMLRAARRSAARRRRRFQRRRSRTPAPRDWPGRALTENEPAPARSTVPATQMRRRRAINEAAERSRREYSGIQRQVDVNTNRAPRRSQRKPESLNVHDFEVAVIDALSPLLGRSPRALKRFVNLYRLIKAGLTPTEHDVFVHRSEKGLDDYRRSSSSLPWTQACRAPRWAIFDVLLAVGRGAGKRRDEGVHGAAREPLCRKERGVRRC